MVIFTLYRWGAHSSSHLFPFSTFLQALQCLEEFGTLHPPRHCSWQHFPSDVHPLSPSHSQTRKIKIIENKRMQNLMIWFIGSESTNVWFESRIKHWHYHVFSLFMKWGNNLLNWFFYYDKIQRFKASCQ